MQPREHITPEQNELLRTLQRDAFTYFIHKTNPTNGLVLDKSREGWPASIAAVGLALAAYPGGVECGFMTRDDAVRRTLATLRFFARRPHGPGPDATGHKGFYYHFLDMNSGQRAWRSELSSVDTAFLLAGMLAAAAYYQQQTAEEDEIRTLADALYRKADWQWMQDGGSGGEPRLDAREGLSAVPLERLRRGAASSICSGWDRPPTRCRRRATAPGRRPTSGRRIYGIEFLYAGPLFIHQLSHVWVDFRGIRDEFMRQHDLDYFENSRRATFVQQQYAIRNPCEFEHYDEFCWGITSSDGPGPGTLLVDGIERVLLRLHRPRRTLRSRRRYAGTVGGGRVVAVRAGDRAAHDPEL